MLLEVSMRLSCILLTAAIAFAAGKGPPSAQAANEKLAIHATAYLDKESIRSVVGAEMQDGIVVILVKLSPKAGPVPVQLDEFLLRSDKDGQRATPYTPSQIAGSSVLMVGSKYGGGGVAMQENGPIWGGIGGTMPRRMPGDGGGIGNTSTVAEAVTKVGENAPDQKEAPLLAKLKEKVLREDDLANPTEGQLYFLMEGKHKVKQIELIYRGPAGRLALRFKE
jgi:hypothetical protein